MQAFQTMRRALNRSAPLALLDLEQTVAAYLNGNANNNQVAAAYYRSNRVNRLILHACQKYRSCLPTDFAQEIKQELVLLLDRKFLATIENPSAIYNVLHVSACFIARRRAEKVCEESLDQILESSQPAPDQGYSYPVRDHEDLIDHRRAVEDFNRRALIESKAKEQPAPMVRARTAVAQKRPVTGEPQPAGALTSISTTASDAAGRGSANAHDVLATPLRIYFDLNDVHVVQRVVKAPRKKSKGPVGPTPRSLEIKAIRERLRLSIDAFAQLLGVKKPVMTAYIYGHLYPPERVLNEARLLERNQSTEIRKLSTRFDGVPMAQIIDGWLEMLGLRSAGRAQTPGDAKLGEVLGLNRVTIWRWRHEKIRPELRDIGAFDTLVRKRAAAIHTVDPKP